MSETDGVVQPTLDSVSALRRLPYPNPEGAPPARSMT